ncbi:MAG TPA: site-specific DNA-methyltransferase [Holophaga sp.]|nr:site-specific DNA-methyltransferase [Holophaga sp.]
MPSLHWRGKDAVLNHHLDVPYHLLKCEPEISVGCPGSGNLIVEGDNLLALKALLPYYKGQVKCMYIDPPYNTGQEEWVYNNNVNSPEIRGWLGEVVGKDAEDLNRHDKWLCMMWPRIKLLHQFLSDDGIMFVSLDDNELPRLRQIMEDIFGEQNFLAQIIIQSNKRGQTYKQIAKTHEYLLCYGRSCEAKLGELETSGSNLPEEDQFGKYSSRELRNRNPKFGRHNRPNLFFTIFADTSRPDEQGNFPVSTVGAPGWVSIEPFNSTGVESCWRWGKEKVDKNTASLGTKTLYAKQTREGGWRVFEKYRKESVKAKSIWFDTKHISEQGTNELGRIGLSEVFQFPKPVGLIQDCILLATDEDSIILDSFAGSGTTAQAVMNLNAEDGGNRRFILVEMDPTIARTVTAERVRRVARGYTNAKGEAVPGLGSDFRYCTLGTPLFRGNGSLNEELSREALARHLFFTEFGEPLPEPPSGESSLVGTFGDTALHLLWDEDGPGFLDAGVLRALPAWEGEFIVFGEGCAIPASVLQEHRISFRQVPYRVRS